jgi:hypothetical protein
MARNRKESVYVRVCVWGRVKRYENDNLGGTTLSTRMTAFQAEQGCEMQWHIQVNALTMTSAIALMTSHNIVKYNGILEYKRSN